MHIYMKGGENVSKKSSILSVRISDESKLWKDVNNIKESTGASNSQIFIAILQFAAEKKDEFLEWYNEAYKYILNH